MIELNSISKSFKNKLALDSISLKIPTGSCFCFVGKNGAGKSTLLSIIADLLLPDKGEVIINGKDYINYPIEIKEKLDIWENISHY